MNPSRHLSSHWDFYQDLVRGDLDDAESHRKFYDEYNAVLDMPAEFYLETRSTSVFQDFLLPRGTWDIDGERVSPQAIKAQPPCSPSKANSTTSPAPARPKPRTTCAPASPPSAGAH